eukprot:XP_011677459.1 PREDICTED: uncharacterized protein LOC105444648 [Strongylocentrotus purpuratus]
MSGTVLVTSRQWRAHEICSNTQLKKVYAFIYIEGFSVDNLNAYITKFFSKDAASSQELIDFIKSNKVITCFVAPFPIFIALLCIMWRESYGKRRGAISKLKTYSQLFDAMFDFLVDHYVSKDDSRTGPNVQELRRKIPNHLKAINKIAFQGILDRCLEFPEDTFQSCRESLEMGCKVGVLTRVKHATPRCERRMNPSLEMSMVQFPHRLFQEFMAANYLASLHSSYHEKYERIMADMIHEDKSEIRYLLYFTSSRGSELGLDIVTRLIAHARRDSTRTVEGKAYKIKRPTDEMEITRMIRKRFIKFARCVMPGLFTIWDDEFLIDVAYESQHRLVAKKVGNQLMKSRATLEIHEPCSAHTLCGYLFIKDHLV